MKNHIHESRMMTFLRRGFYLYSSHSSTLKMHFLVFIHSLAQVNIALCHIDSRDRQRRSPHSQGHPLGNQKVWSKGPTARQDLKLDISQSKLIEKPQTPQVKMWMQSLSCPLSLLPKPDRSSPTGGINRGRLICDYLMHRQ